MKKWEKAYSETLVKMNLSGNSKRTQSGYLGKAGGDPISLPARMYRWYEHWNSFWERSVPNTLKSRVKQEKKGRAPHRENTRSEEGSLIQSITERILMWVVRDAWERGKAHHGGGPASKGHGILQ